MIGAIAAAAALLMTACASRQSKLEKDCCENAMLYGCGGEPARGCGADGHCGMGECKKDYDCGSKKKDKKKGKNNWGL